MSVEWAAVFKISVMTKGNAMCVVRMWLVKNLTELFDLACILSSSQSLLHVTHCNVVGQARCRSAGAREALNKALIQ